MADNVTLPGTGAVVSTEDIGGGVELQRVKVTHGAAGSATDVSTASPLPAAGYGMCAETEQQVEVLVDSTGRVVPMLDSIRYLLEALVGRSGFQDGSGNLRVNLNAQSGTVTVTQGTAATAPWPVYSAPSSGYAEYLQQHYLSMDAFRTLRMNVTVS